MANYKEIVTKAVLGKGKKTFTTTSTVTPTFIPTTILGCWVINHNFKGHKENENVVVEGSYDVNIWYSCENDTKTEVIKDSNTYKESVIVNKKESTDLANDEIIVRSLKQPSCIKAEIKDGKIEYTIEKQLGIEIVGDTKVKIQYDDNEDPWDDLTETDVDSEIDKEVKEDYI